MSTPWTVWLLAYLVGMAVFYGCAVAYQLSRHISPPPKPPRYGVKVIAMVLWPVFVADLVVISLMSLYMRVTRGEWIR